MVAAGTATVYPKIQTLTLKHAPAWPWCVVPHRMQAGMYAIVFAPAKHPAFHVLRIASGSTAHRCAPVQTEARQHHPLRVCGWGSLCGYVQASSIGWSSWQEGGNSCSATGTYLPRLCLRGRWRKPSEHTPPTTPSDAAARACTGAPLCGVSCPASRALRRSIAEGVGPRQVGRPAEWRRWWRRLTPPHPPAVEVRTPNRRGWGGGGRERSRPGTHGRGRERENMVILLSSCKLCEA